MTTTTVAVSGPCLPNSDCPSEKVLVDHLRTGDAKAYEQLFRTHAGALMAVARKFFGDTDDAAEAVQDAFVSAFKSIGKFEGTARLGTWLHRITVNACLMKLRLRKRSRFVPLDDLLPPPARTEEDAMMRAEMVDRVRACIDQLPLSYREITLLRDIEGLDTAETANRLGTNEGVVKTRLHRARQALRLLLDPAKK